MLAPAQESNQEQAGGTAAAESSKGSSPTPAEDQSSQQPSQQQQEGSSEGGTTTNGDQDGDKGEGQGEDQDGNGVKNEGQGEGQGEGQDENKSSSDQNDSKRKNEEQDGGDDAPDAKKVKTEENSNEPTPLEKAQQAAERARIAMLPELDPAELPAEGSNLPKHQHKYALSAIRAIKRLKDAAPFVAPVDPVRQGVPQYFDYIKNPMDLGTMEKKLVDGKYDTIKDFVNDFNLIVSNCIIFNGEEALISKMALSIAQSFKKQLSNMPTFDASRKGSQAAAAAAAASAAAASRSAVAATASGTTTNDAAAVAGGSEPGSASPATGDLDSALHDDHVGKRASTTTTIVGPNGLPTLRRKSTIDGRPKREIRPPRHPGSSYVGSGSGEGRPRNKKYAAELRFAGQVLREMQGRKLDDISFPFLAPVDPIEQGVPNYFDVIKEPMDLSTIHKKLTEGIYYNADEFESDIRLMFRNCYTFNPEGTLVNVMGHKLEAYFDSRWVEKPVPGAHAAEDSDVSDVDEDYAETGMVNPAIDVLEEQLRLIKKQLKRLKKEALADYYKRGRGRVAGGPKRRQSSHGGGAGSGTGNHKPLPTEMTYEMKRELRDKIDKLPEKKIRTVIAIIQESMPDLGNNGQDEIELEVDALDTNTLLRLYNYAVLGRREEPGSGSGNGGAGGAGGAGSGGLGEYDAFGQPNKQRRSKALSEEEHVRKIAEIESKLKEFDNAASPSSGGTPTAAGSAGSGVNAVEESDSSDDEPQQFESDDSSSEEE